MTRSWWPIFAAALITLTTGAATASAQTVYVRNAKPGETVDVVLNGAKAATAQADQAGEAKLTLDLAKINKTEIDANVFLDSCDSGHQVIISERGATVPATEPGGNCTRRDIQGVFWIRAINTIVVNFSADANPSLLLVKGTYTPRDIAVAQGTVPKRVAPTGLALFGGGAFTSFSDSLGNACGNVGDCSGHGAGFGFTVGGTYWFNRFLGFDAAYLRPRPVTAKGTGDTYRFDTEQRSDIVTLMGKVGATAGIARIYGQVGVDYHQDTSDTSETIDARTITVDGVAEAIPGGTQSIQLKTDGWGPVFGGGLEIWATSAFAIYGEGNYARIKGDRVGAGGEGRIDDKLTYLTVGLRFRVGRAKK